jgi:hypothetical protein
MLPDVNAFGLAATNEKSMSQTLSCDQPAFQFDWPRICQIDAKPRNRLWTVASRSHPVFFLIGVYPWATKANPVSLTFVRLWIPCDIEIVAAQSIGRTEREIGLREVSCEASHVAESGGVVRLDVIAVPESDQVVKDFFHKKQLLEEILMET